MSKQSERLRRLIAFVLLLFTVHVPLPCYDADGENRGRITQGLDDPAAWHIVLLGVVPESDVDRGPFKTDSSESNLSGSAFDAAFISSARILVPQSDDFISISSGDALAQSLTSSGLIGSMPAQVHQTFGASYSMRAPQAWRRHLCLMLI